MRAFYVGAGIIYFFTALVLAVPPLLVFANLEQFFRDSEGFAALAFAATFVLFVVASGAAGLFLVRKRNSPMSRTTGTLLGISVVILIFLWTLPNFLHARKRSASTRILEDLRMLDAAVDQYSMQSNARESTSTLTDPAPEPLTTIVLSNRPWAPQPDQRTDLPSGQSFISLTPPAAPTTHAAHE